MIKLIDFIEETAPTGSGTDFDYTNIKINTKRKISFENAFHLMDSESGMYIAVIPFRVTINKDLQLKVQFLNLNPHGWYLVRYVYTWVREDLENLYQEWLNAYKLEILDIFK